MRIQAKAYRKRKIRADPDEHPPPIGMVQIEVVRFDPPLFVFQVPTVLLLIANGRENARGFTRLQNTNHLIILGAFEIRIPHFVAAGFRIVDNGHSPFLRSVLDPMVVLRRDIAQDVATDGIPSPVAPEKSEDPFYFLKRLNDPVQQHTIETSVMETDVILVVLVERVHGETSCWFAPRRIKPDGFYEHSSCRIIINSTSGAVRWITPSAYMS